jgi:deazaflavin-dependent oxidoreductase (nitroreductase family)
MFMRIQIVVYRLTNGRVMATVRGMPVLLLTTVGRKTKKARTTPLMYIRDGESYVVTASNNGRDRYPSWFHNLQASPQGEIEVAGAKLEVTTSVASPTEYERLWPQLVARAPFFEGYRKRTSRPIPMLILKER